MSVYVGEWSRMGGGWVGGRMEGKCEKYIRSSLVLCVVRSKNMRAVE